MIPADAVVAPVTPKPLIVQPPPPVITPPVVVPKGVKPKRIIDDIERPVTPQEYQEANEILALGKGRGNDIDTVQGVRELREAILQGRVKATEPRKIELGFLPETKVQIKIPKKGNTIKAKFTKEQYKKYLETARRLGEQKKKRLVDAINNVVNGAE